MDAEADGSGVSTADAINEQLAARGLEVVLVKANKDRLNGWTRLKAWLNPKRRQPDGTTAPYLRFLEGLRHTDEDTEDLTARGCPYLIQTIGAQLYDENKPGDMKKGATDHGCDAWRYLLMAREPITHVPIDKRPRKTHDQRVTQYTRVRVLKQLAANNRELAAEGDEETGTGVYDGRGQLDAFANALAGEEGGDEIADAWS